MLQILGYTTKKNPQTLQQFEEAITKHLADKHTTQIGTYIPEKNSVVYYNSQTHNVAVFDEFNNFVNAWKLDPTSLQFSNYMKNLALR